MTETSKSRENRRLLRYAALLAAQTGVVAATLGTGGCSLISADGTECHFKANNPHQSSGSPGYIVGKAQFFCEGTKTPSTVTATVKIQRLVASSWHDIPGTQRQRLVAPFALGPTYVAQTGPMRCAIGVFRTAVRGTGVLAGVERSSPTWEYSQTVRNPCD